MDKYLSKLNSLNIQFLKNNYLYIIWFVFYFVFTWIFLGATIISFVLDVILYGVSIGIAFSPLGEKILRFINGVRRLETKREKEYIIPIFQDVYTEAHKRYNDLTNDIEICIIDAMHINAVALGTHTIAVTKGAVQSLSEDELKGFIAHEIGHIYNGDTKALLLTNIGNGIFTIFVVIAKTIMNFFEALINSRRGLIGVFMYLMNFINVIVLFIFCNIGQIILSINSRANEYGADEFAYKIGYGIDLVDGLYMLQDMCLSERKSLVDKLKESHPHIAKRIGRLESIIDTEIHSE